MKLPYWISQYAPLSSAEGEIESLIVILPPEESLGRCGRYQPILDEFNSTRRAIIKFHNEYDPAHDFWDSLGKEKDKDPIMASATETDSKEIGYSPSSSNVKAEYENTTRTYNPDAQKSLDGSEGSGENDWEEDTRYFISTKPSFNPRDLVQKWVEEAKSLDKSKARGNKPSKEPYRKWVQDPFYCLQKPDQVNLETTLLYSIYQQSLADFILPIELSQRPDLNLRSHPTQLIIEGGNILFIDKILFIGKELIQKNIYLLNKRDNVENWDDIKVLSLFEEQFNVVQAVSLGTEKPHLSFDVDRGKSTSHFSHRVSYQPFFHLDIYLNFGGIDEDSGKRIAFLGNPKEALDILNGKIPDPDSLPDSNQMKEGPGHPQEGKKVYGTIMQIEELIERTQPFYDNLKEQLKEAGLVVVEVPLYVFAEPNLNGYVYCSWNNCLVEVYNQGRTKHIYLPSYEISDRPCDTGHNEPIALLEKRVIKLYKSHGFKTHLINAGRLFRTAAKHGGSLHCMVKVLRRKYS